MQRALALCHARAFATHTQRKSMTKVWIKTEAGQQAFKQRSVQLAGKLRSAFLLCDGFRTPEQVLAATQGLSVTLEDMQALVQAGLLQQVSRLVGAESVLQTVAVAPALAPTPVVVPRSLQDRYRDAYPMAKALTGQLGQAGQSLHLQVQAARSYQELAAVAAHIKAAVGQEAFAPLEQVLFE